MSLISKGRAFPFAQTKINKRNHVFLPLFLSFPQKYVHSLRCGKCPLSRQRHQLSVVPDYQRQWKYRYYISFLSCRSLWSISKNSVEYTIPICINLSRNWDQATMLPSDGCHVLGQLPAGGIVFACCGSLSRSPCFLAVASRCHCIMKCWRKKKEERNKVELEQRSVRAARQVGVWVIVRR